MIAKLEEKKRQEEQETQPESALTTTDVGHDMDPNDKEIIQDKDDKDAAAYAKVNLNDTENSV